MYLYPYNSGSKSARLLAEALDAKMIRREGSKFQGSSGKVVVNWGCPEVSEQVRRCRILNNPERVSVAHNKLRTFRALEGSQVSCVPYTTSQEVAQGWLEKGITVVARKSLTGHSGAGITILERGDWVDAPLYTQYIPKDREYRLHVVNGSVVDVQRKVADPEREVKDWKVRSHGNGFIFVRSSPEGVVYRNHLEPGVEQNALLFVRTLGLDFCGVDVIWNRKKNRSYILEGNTACGLEGATVEVYANALRKLGA